MDLKPYQIKTANGRKRIVIAKSRPLSSEASQLLVSIAAYDGVATAARKLVGLVDGGQETLEDRNEALDGVRRSLQVLDALDDTVHLTAAGRAALGKGA